MHSAKKITSFFFIRLSWIVILLLSGCTSISDASSSGKTYEIDSSLIEFYNSLGGETMLGPVISRVFEDPAGQCQYTVNVLMCFNPSVGEGGGYSLAPLAESLKIKEYSAESLSGNGLVVNGFAVYEEFLPLFDQFAQTTYAGNPVTQVQLNYNLQRIEQYFEKVGFYRKFSDPAGTVKLLAYGAESCTKCRYQAGEEAAVTAGSQIADRQNFIAELKGIQQKQSFGDPLTAPYLSQDGNLEQVYSGIVLYKDAEGIVHPRPLSILLGMQSGSPGEKIYSRENGMVFYAVQENLGFHVPLIFDDFIQQHGGTAISGDPISEAVEVESGLLRQCFTNYCLDYAPEAPKRRQVSIAPLGEQYLLHVQNLPAPVQESLPPAPQTVLLQVREQLDKVSKNDQQIIEIQALNNADQSAIAGVESELTINLTNGKVWTSLLPATDVDGHASIAVPEMKNIPNGTILFYQVCVTNLTVESSCAAGSYLYWDLP